MEQLIEKITTFSDLVDYEIAFDSKEYTVNFNSLQEWSIKGSYIKVIVHESNYSTAPWKYLSKNELGTDECK